MAKKQRVWHPTLKNAKSIASRVKVGDAVSNPVCRRDMKATAAKRDEAYRAADAFDAALAARGLKTDHPSTCVWFVERKR